MNDPIDFDAESISNSPIDFDAESIEKSVLKYGKVTKPKYIDEDGFYIDCMVEFPSIQDAPAPFTAYVNDCTEHGRQIFKELIDGKWGAIAPLDVDFLKKKAVVAANGNRSAWLATTDWLVSRHRDEKELDGPTTLGDNQYSELQAYRAALRDWPNSPEFPDKAPTAPKWLK